MFVYAIGIVVGEFYTPFLHRFLLMAIAIIRRLLWFSYIVTLGRCFILFSAVDIFCDFFT
jgi:hypothetical protein